MTEDPLAGWKGTVPFVVDGRSATWCESCRIYHFGACPPPPPPKLTLVKP